MAKGKKISISPYIFFKGIILFTILAKLKSRRQFITQYPNEAVVPIHPYGNSP